MRSLEGAKQDSENEGGVRIKRRKEKYIQHSGQVTEEEGHEEEKNKAEEKTRKRTRWNRNFR